MKRGNQAAALAGSVLALVLAAAAYGADETTLPELLREKGILSDEEAARLGGAETGTAKPVAPQIGYDNGFFLRTPDGNFSLTLTGRVALHFRFSEADSSLPNTETVDRARLGVEATFYRYFKLKLENDFTSSSGLRDAFFAITRFPAASLQLGQYKIPFSYEELVSKKYIDFVERSAVVNSTVNPSRDIGVMLYGSLAAKRLQYQASVMNGTGQNASDDNGDKDLVGRVVLAPFAAGESAFQGLNFGGAVTWGKQARKTTKLADGTTSLVANSVAGTTETGFAFFPAVPRRGDRTRAGAHVAWLAGPFSASGEYITTSEERAGLGPNREDLPDLDTEGAYLGATWLLTGETKPFNARVKPARPLFGPGGVGWGAFEAALRWEFFELEHDPDAAGEPEVRNRYDAVVAGLNWYPIELLRFSVNYLYGHFDEIGDGRSPDPDRHSNNAVLGRAQLEF